MHELSREIDISKSNTSLHIKFALVCLNKAAFPKWLGLLCFVLSHFQFIALAIKSVYLALDDDTPSSSPAIHLFIKLFVVGDWLSPTNTAPIIVGIVISTIYLIKILAFMVYIHVSLFLKRKIPSKIQKYWGLLHSLHPLVVFSWIHTFSMEIIQNPPQAEGAQGARVMAYINTVINCVLGVFFSIISATFKTKDVLSSKTDLLETKTVFFKLIIPTLWKAAEKNQGIQIFVLLLVLLSSLLHDWMFLRYLPYYRIRILLLSAGLQSIQTSLALTGCIVKFVEAGGTDIGVFAFQMASLMLMPIAIKLYYSYAWRLILYIFSCEIKDEKNVYYLVHKRFILLYFLKSRIAIHGGINQFSLADIMYQARLVEIVTTNSSESLTSEKLDKNKKLLVRNLKVICLEILKLHPRALLVQINLASAYSKFEDLYLVSNNLLEDALSKRPWYHAQISLNMIRLELQKKLKLEFSEKTGEEGLNVHSFIINQELYEKMKTKIRKQAETQLNFWTEFGSNKPKMMDLVNIALEVNSQRKMIRRLWNSFIKIRPTSFLSPLIIYGMYSSLINNNPVEGDKYVEQSQKDAKRESKNLKVDELNNQTIFSEKSVQITMAGLKSKLGKIMDCSKNIANFYGWQSSDMKGRPVISLMPPFFRQRHDSFLLNHFNTGETGIMNATRMVPVKRVNGYIHPTWIHIKVSPLMDSGMSYIALLRPCKSSKRMILVRKDGRIDDMSFEFAKDMNLLGKEDQYETDIFELCSQFKQINEAFNIIAERIIENRIQKPYDESEMKTQANLFLTDRSPRITERPLLNVTGRKIRIDTDVDDEIPIETTVERFTSLPGIEINQAQSICDSFINGSTLVFHPRNEQREPHKSEPITYHVKINNSTHGKDTIKIVLLERVDHNMEQSTDEEGMISSFQKGTSEIPRGPTKDVLFSPKAFTQSLATGYETERAELISLATSPRENNGLLSPKTIYDESNFSVNDEIRDDDSAVRKTISRNITKGKNSTSDSPRRKKQEVQNTLFTEQNEKNPLNEMTNKRSQAHLLVSKEAKTNIRRNQLKQELVENVAQIETSVASSYLSKGKKAEQLVIRALKSEPKKRSASIFTYLFLLFLLVMVILLIVQNTNLRAGIKDVQSQVPVIGAGFYRQYNMVYTALEVLQLKIFLGGTLLVGTWPGDKALLTGYLEYYVVKMKGYNTQFYELLNKLPVDIQGKFYKKSVGLYDSDENGNKTLVGMFTTFEAFQIMLEKEFYCVYMDIPDQFEEGIDTSNHKFIMDNILNDLLIESQHQNVELIEDLDKSTRSTTVKMGLTMGIALAVWFVFVLISIRYLWVIASEARIFMVIIFRIKLQECEAIKRILENFISALDTDMKSGGGFLAPSKTKTITEDQQNNNTLRFRKASMRSFYRSQRVAFMKLLPIYCLFICWNIVYFVLARDFMGNIQDSERRMVAVLQALSSQAVLVYEQGSVTLTNGTDIVLNKSIIADYRERLNNLVQVDRLVNSFRDKNGKLTALQEKILYDFRCEDLLPYLAKDYEGYIYTYNGCVTIAKGTGSAGLMKINSELYTTASDVLEMFENSNKTQDELNEIFITGLLTTGDLINTAEGFYNILYSATYESFDENVDSVQKKTLYFTIFIVIGTGVATLITWYLVMKKIFRAQKIDWFILQLIPVKLILGNKHIQQYLLRHSDGSHLMHELSHEVNIPKSNAPIYIKFALVCLNKAAFPKWLGFLCFILSRLQFIALIIKSAYVTLDDNTPSSSPTIRFFVKLSVVGDCLSPTKTAPIITGIVIITIYTMKMLSLMVYIHFSLFLKTRIPDKIQKYWGLLHSLHPLVMFFWIHTFCMEIILSSAQTEAIRMMALLNTIINCALAEFFCIISATYKTKDVLSSKTNLLEIKTVLFKIIIPTLWKTTHQGVQILTLIIAFLSGILQDWIFVKYLPYYRINMLLLSAGLQSIQTSLALTGCIVKFVEAGGADIGIFTFQMVSVMLMPIALKLYYSYTWRLLLYIFRCEMKSENNVYYLVHKRFILLYFLKSRKAIHGGVNQFSLADIMYQARLAEIITTNSSEFLTSEKLDKNKKLLVRNLKVICLEISKLHPRALLAQINLASAYSKFEDLYLVSNNLLEDALLKRPWYHEQISLNMIRLELQKKFKLLFSQKTGEEGLNIDSYVINQELYERLKNNVRKQAEMQLNFWTEFMSNKPKLMDLVNSALEVNSQRKVVRRLWNHLLRIRPASFFSPLIVYGMYSSLIDNNPVEGEKYIEQSQEDGKRESKNLKVDELNNQTIFSETSVQITMAGLKSKLGKIMDCSANISNFYGWQSSDMKGRPVISLMPPFFRQRHDSFLLNHFNTGETGIMNATRMVPVKRVNGYIHPTWIHIKVSPLMDSGMSYIALLRPCKSNKRMILVRKNGKIDDMSFEFAKDMNLLGKEDQYETDIFGLCPEFNQINESFNLIAENLINNNHHHHSQIERENNDFHDHEIHSQRNLLLSERNEDTTLLSRNPRQTQIDPETAQFIYEKFTKGSTLVFYPQNRNTREEALTYEVKISNSIHGKDTIKIVLLEKISEEYGNMTQSGDEKEDVISSFPIIPNQMKQKGKVSSPKMDTEGAELICLSTSPKERKVVQLIQPINEITDLSILDEVQNDDSVRRTTISRNIIEGRKATSGSPRRKKQSEIQVTEPQSAFFTEHNEGKPLKQREKAQPKEEGHKVRLSKLKQGLVEHVAQIETSVASSYLSKGKKAEQLVIRALKSEPKKRSASIFTYLFLLFLLAMVILLIVQNTNLRAGIKYVQSQIPVISAGYFRQFNMIYSALEVLQVKGNLEGKFVIDTWMSDNLLLRSYLGYYTTGMKEYNSRFYELLNDLPVSMQSNFYKKNVGIYDSDEDGGNKTLIGMFTTFEAFQLMIEKEDACLYTEIPDQFEEGIDTSNYRFILNNILNDLLIESQRETVQLTNDLNESTNSITLKMGLTMGSGLIVCGVFIMVSVRYLWVLASEARIFMIIIFRIKPHECEAIKGILENFISALDADMRKGDFLSPSKTKTITEDQQNNNTLRFRKASMRSLNRSQRVAFIKMLPIYSLFICWSLVYFFLAKDFMRNIRDSAKRMQASLQALNNQPTLVYGLASIPLTNGMDMVKNKPILDIYQEYLDNLVEVDRFVDGFRDGNGKLTALQQKVLFDFPCDDLLPYVAKDYEGYIGAYESCLALGNGAASSGMVEINAGLYAAASYLLQLYENSNKTEEELADIFATGLGMCGDFVNVAEVFLLFLYDATNESFEDDVDSIKRRTIIFTIFILIGTGVTTLITWYLVMKKIFRSQKIDWFILQLIPVKLILGNKHIQQYLLRHSDGVFDGVKGFI